MSRKMSRMYNARPPPPGRETITIGDRRRIKVECISNMDVIFHGKRDQRITLIDVAYVPDLGFNLHSLHAVQRTHLIVSDASGTHVIRANLTFPRRYCRSETKAMRHTRNKPFKAVGTPHSTSAAENPPPQKHVRDRFTKFKCSGSCYSTGTDSLSPSQSCVEFDENEETESWPFCELVGGLMWLAISTRPDISNAVRFFARYCSAPKAVHWKSALVFSHTSMVLVVLALRTSDRAKEQAKRNFERTSSTYPASRDEVSDAAAGTCPHRHRWALPNFSWGVAVRRDVRRQRFASTAAVRRAREERGRHSFCRETLRGRYEGPRRVTY